MKKVIALIMAITLILSVGVFAKAQDEKSVDFTNKICTIRLLGKDYLTASGSERGNALTVGKTAAEWRFKSFAGGAYSFIGNGDLACDVNSASRDAGTTIIQWTATGAGNQRWTLEDAEGGYYIKSAFSELYLTENDGVITQEEKTDGANQVWVIDVVGQFEPVVEKMLVSDAAKSLSEYRYERLYDYVMSGGEFNMLVYDKIEKMIGERDYFNLTQEEQKAFVEECFTVVSTDLMYGSMATKLQRDIKVEYVGIEEGAWQSWHGIPEEAPRLYNVTITDKETGDSHVVQYISPYDNDEEYAVVVGEAIACFEMPVIKTLWRFVYTSMNTSSWNGGDGTIWNNTAYRCDVNNMVQMFAHELGHVMDNGRQHTDVWYRAIAQDMVPVTGSGNTNRWEDLAEFSRMYLLAKGDDARIEAIENTYPARTVAYKALLFNIDGKFYEEYKDENEAVLSQTGDYDKSEIVKLSVDGKYLTDNNGVLTLEEARDVINDWQSWEIYTLDAGSSKVLNKATGRQLSVADGRLTLGQEGNVGFKSQSDNYVIIDGATGFVIDKELNIALEDGALWKMEKTGDIPYNDTFKIKLAVNGKYLTFVEGEGLQPGDEGYEWTFVPVEKGYYLLMDKATGKVFDISGGSYEIGASAILYSVTGGWNQHFSLKNNGDGTYKLVLRHSGLGLTFGEDGAYQGEGNNWILER